MRKKGQIHTSRLASTEPDLQNIPVSTTEELDIHALTASQMFNVPIDGISPAVRRRFKAINFYSIYGISADYSPLESRIPKDEQ